MWNVELASVCLRSGLRGHRSGKKFNFGFPISLSLGFDVRSLASIRQPRQSTKTMNPFLVFSDSNRQHQQKMALQRASCPGANAGDQKLDPATRPRLLEFWTLRFDSHHDITDDRSIPSLPHISLSSNCNSPMHITRIRIAGISLRIISTSFSRRHGQTSPETYR